MKTIAKTGFILFTVLFLFSLCGEYTGDVLETTINWKYVAFYFMGAFICGINLIDGKENNE